MLPLNNYTLTGVVTKHKTARFQRASTRNANTKHRITAKSRAGGETPTQDEARAKININQDEVYWQLLADLRTKTPPKNIANKIQSCSYHHLISISSFLLDIHLAMATA